MVPENTSDHRLRQREQTKSNLIFTQAEKQEDIIELADRYSYLYDKEKEAREEMDLLREKILSRTEVGECVGRVRREERQALEITVKLAEALREAGRYKDAVTEKIDTGKVREIAQEEETVRNAVEYKSIPVLKVDKH